MRMLVAFLAADSELLESHVLNKAAAWAAGGDNPMIHTEILFVDRETEDGFVGRSCSIHYGGKVFFQQKKFSRNQWRFRSVNTSDTQLQAALQFCQEHVGEPFNKIGFYMQPFTGKRLAQKSWFCSEIVAGALNAAGFNIEPSLHPQTLFETIAERTTPDCPRSLEMKF